MSMHAQAESTGVLARVSTPSSPVRKRERERERERERPNFYACKVAQTLFSGQTEREREIKAGIFVFSTRLNSPTS